MKKQFSRGKRLIVAMVGIAIASAGALGYAFFWFVMPFSPIGRPQEVASFCSADGAKAKILQVFTGTLEPYEVSLFVCYDGDDAWTQYVLDPDGLYWRAKLGQGRDNSEVIVTREGHNVAILNLSTRTVKRSDGRDLSPAGWVKGDPIENKWLSMSSCSEGKNRL